MGSEAAERQQAKIQEFMKLLPLTLELAGLPRAQHGEYLNEGQLEVRANQIRKAYKYARQLVIEVSKPSEG
ncbi:MAG TPA: hypothetical protein VIL46_06020 [Gemmataceae bacterium]